MTTATAVPRMKALYDETLRDQLKTQLELGNVMQVPRLKKIVVNMGVGDALVNRAMLDGAVADLAQSHDELSGANEELRVTVAKRDSLIEKLESEIVQLGKRREVAVQRLDGLVQELDRLDAELDRGATR